MREHVRMNTDERSYDDPEIVVLRDQIHRLQDGGLAYDHPRIEILRSEIRALQDGVRPIERCAWCSEEIKGRGITHVSRIHPQLVYVFDSVVCRHKFAQEREGDDADLQH